MPVGRLLLHLPATKSSARRFVVPVYSRSHLSFDSSENVLATTTFKCNRVVQGELKNGGRPVAVKIVPWSRSNLAWNEVELLAQLKKHPYLLNFVGIAQDRENLLVLTDLVSPRTVAEVAQPDPRWLTQTAHAMSHLHAQDVIHRDLRASHLLLSLDGKEIRLADLDRSCVLKEHLTIETDESPSPYLPEDTLAFSAPEVIAGKPHGRKIDVYSFGILMHDVCHPQTPYAAQVSALPRDEYAKRVLEEGMRPRWSFPDQNLKRLAERCLSFDPEERPDFDEVSEALARDFPIPGASKQHSVSVSQLSNGPETERKDGEMLEKRISRVGTCASIGLVREFMEDALAVLETHRGELICGVFDGLKMSRTAEFAARNWALNALEGLLSEAKEELTAGNEKPDRKKALETILKTSLVRTDEALKQVEPPVECGSTATVSIVSPERVSVSWLGDSSAFLFRRHGDNFQATALINKHAPNRADERERIEKSNGLIMREQALMHDGSRVAVGPWRVMAHPTSPEQAEKLGHAIAVSRALGLFDYRPVISGDPELVSVDRIPANDICLVLASDGLWDLLDLRQVLQVLLKAKGDPQRAAEALVKRVLDLGAHDNVSVIVVKLD